MAFFVMSLTGFHIAQKDNEIVPRNLCMSVCKITILLLCNAQFSYENLTFFTSSTEVGNDDIKGGKF